MVFCFLSKAHEKQRRAEASLREGKFEEAAKYHETVADLLAKAHEKLESSLVHVHGSAVSSQEPYLIPIHLLNSLESLSLQQDYHKRQAAVVRYRIIQVPNCFLPVFCKILICCMNCYVCSE